MSLTTSDGGYPNTPETRKFSPRRRLPSGRAVVGALLVTVAAVGTFVLASSDDSEPDTAYLVATQPIPAGSSITPENVTFHLITLPAVVANNAVSDSAGVVGATATRDLVVGEIILAHDLVAAPTVDGAPVGAVHELAFPVSGDRIASNTAAGDRVTVLTTLTLEEDERTELTTLVITEDALVLEWSGGEGISGSGVLTLALDDAATAMGVAHLIRQGNVTVVRTTRATADIYPTQVRMRDLISLRSATPQPGTAQPGTGQPDELTRPGTPIPSQNTGLPELTAPLEGDGQ